MTPMAGIGLSSLPAEKFSVSMATDVVWPTGCDYTAAITEEVTGAVQKLVEEELGAEITVSEIEFCDIGSSEHAFRIAAREATQALISIGPLSEFPSQSV